VESHSLARKFFALTPLFWVAAISFLLLLCGVYCRTGPHGKGGCGDDRMGPSSASLIQRWRIKMGRIRFRLPEIVGRGRRPRGRTENQRHSVPANAPADPLKKAYPADARAIGVRHRCPRDPNPRGVRLAESKGIDERSNCQPTTTSALRNSSDMLPSRNTLSASQAP